MEKKSLADTIDSLVAEAAKGLKATAPKAKQKPLVAAPPKADRPRPSPWCAEAVVLYLTRLRCRCGTEVLMPQPDLLVRFRHKRRTNDIWEIAGHPAQTNPDLPRETVIWEATTTWCASCWIVRDDRQGDLFSHQRDWIETLIEAHKEAQNEPKLFGQS